MRSRHVPTVPPLGITDAERAELQRRVRAHTTPQRAAKRARIVLLAADGVPNRQIAPMVGMNEHTVAQWRRPFGTGGLAGLGERKAAGPPFGLSPRSAPGGRPPRTPPPPRPGQPLEPLAAGRRAGGHGNLG